MKSIKNRKDIILLPILLIGLAIIFSINPVAADPGIIYVNHTSGNDSWDGQYATWQGTGTIFGPKLTIKNATGTVTDGGTVNVASGTYNENNIAIYDKNVNIVGEDKYTTIINGTNTSGILSLSGGWYVKSVTLTGLTFTNGNATGGGAIHNYRDQLTINDCIFQNNVASLTGGAIHSEGTNSDRASLTITNSIFTNNKANGAGWGGAIFTGLSYLTLNNNNFENNIGSTGSTIHNNYGNILAIQFNRIIGTGSSLIYSDNGGDATLNWWGSNADPSTSVSGVTVDPWLVLTTTANPSIINNDDGTSTFITSTITADFQHDQYGNYYDPLTYGHIPDGLEVSFSSDTSGTVNPLTNTIVNGGTSTIFTAGPTVGTSTITATADGVPATATVDIVDTPVVISVDPFDGELDVPVTKIITVTFSKAIQVGTAYDSIRVLGTINYLGITKNIVGNMLTITPTNYWDSYNILTLPVDAILGLSTELTSSFYTANGPSVTSVDPVDGAVNVPLNKVISVTFDRLIFDSGTGGITLTGPGGFVGITTSIIDNILIITPDTNYDTLSTYYLTIPYDALYDNLGNFLTTDFYSSFTTVPLAVTSVDPVNNAVNVPPNKVITVTFNTLIFAGNMWIDLKNSSGTIVPITTSISGYVLTITPTSALTESLYTLIIHTGSITDIAGNLVALTSSKFSTGTPPTITTIDPANNAVNVPLDKVITVTFSEPIKAGTMWIELYNTIGTKTLIPITISINNNILTIKHTTLLANGTKYTLVLHTGSITDLAGNPLAIVGSYFTTSTDATAPTVTSIDPANNAVNVPTDKVITVTFSEPIKNGTGWIELKNSDGTVIPITLSISGNVLTITPTSALTESLYTLIIHTGSITDIAGNLVALTSSKFSTGTPPTITTIDPANNAVNVPLDKVITVTFSENIKNGTGWIELKSSSGTVIPITTSIIGNVLTINHTALLAPGTKYTLTFHTGSVTDYAGNPLALCNRSFTTGSI